MIKTQKPIILKNACGAVVDFARLTASTPFKRFY